MGDAGAVVIIDRLGAPGLFPIPAVLGSVFGRAVELVRSDAGTVAANAGIVFQGVPGQRIVVVANSEESAESQDGVRHAPARLLNHDALDGSDLLIVGAVHRGA